MRPTDYVFRERETAMFANCLGVLEAAAKLCEGATAGAIQKMNPHMTNGQVRRVLEMLEGEGYIARSFVPYGRTGKYIWWPTERGIINIMSLVRAYNEGEAAR